MAQLYTDEDFPHPVADELRLLGHDVVTALEAGNAGHGLPDADQLAFAIAQGRALLTQNRRHFIKLHLQSSAHSGIVTCTPDDDPAALARRIHDAIQASLPLAAKLVRVIRPAQP